MSEDQDQTDTNAEASAESPANEDAGTPPEADAENSDDDESGDDEASSESKDEDSEDSDEDSEDSDEDSEDSDEDDKPKKAKKVKISYEAAMPRSEAVSYFEAIVGGLRSGRLEFRQEGDHLVLSPPDQLEIEVKAQRKGDKAKVVFEIAWTDESHSLEILN